MLKLKKRVIAIILAVAIVYSAIFVGVLALGSASQHTNILENNTTGALYRLHFKQTPIVQSQPYTPDYNTIEYKNIQLTSEDKYSWRAQTLVSGNYTTAEDQAAAMNLLTTADNTEKVRFYSNAGSSTQLEYRLAILYDLGAYYDLSKLVLNIDNSACQIRNYSVYAGNEPTLSIFENCIGKGGTADSADTQTEAELETTDNYRYVLIVFDHATNQANGVANGFNGGYVPTLTEVKLYGEKVLDLAGNILLGNTTAKLYRTVLTPEFVQESTYSPVEYDNIVECIEGTKDFSVYGEDLNDKNGNNNKTEILSSVDLGETNSELLNNLVAENNTRAIQIMYNGSNKADGHINRNRVGIVYDFGGYYSLESFVLKQKSVGYVVVYNFSVYAGNQLDETIFENKIGSGGSKTETKMTISLDKAKSYRYIIVMFDHVATTYGNMVNHYSYQPCLTGIEAYGRKTGDIVDEIVDESILKDNTTAKLYKSQLSVPLTQEGNYTDSITYDNLYACAQSTSDFITWAEDTYDKNNNGNTTEILSSIALDVKDNELLNALTTDGNTRTIKLGYGGNNATGYSNKNRLGIAYDLGAYYKLNSLVMEQRIVGNISIYNFSVYAGNELDETIFLNKIGSGGTKTEYLLEAEFNCTDSYRYILIMFDHVAATYQDFVNYYTYNPHLVGIEAFGEKTGEIIPEVKPESILKGNKSGALYSIALETPYSHEGAVNIDYSTLKYTNLTLAKKADTYPFLTYTNSDEWEATDEAESLALLTKENNESIVKLQHGRGGDVPLKYRVGILYDLGNWYDLNSVALTVDNTSVQVRNYSVYVGNSVDATIFKNRVGTGGSSNMGDTTLKSTLTGATNVRYLLVVFDHVSNLDVANRYGYTPYLSQVEAFGTVNPNPPKTQGSSYGTNILLGNKSGRVYQVSHNVPHNIEYTPNYKTLKYINLYDSNVRYRRYGTDFEGLKETNTALYDDPSLKIATDGKTDQKILINTGTDRSNGFVESKRIALIYDLGGWYDLSTVVLKQDLSNGTAIRNYSVYAGAFGDSRILENRVGIGGGTHEALVSELSGANSVRYIVIVLDHVTNVTDSLSNYYSYRPFITEIECYGKVNKNPNIPVDTKAADILETADGVKATMVFIEHAFSWTDSFDKGSFNYTSDKFKPQSELAEATFEAWTDGDGSTTAYWSSGITSKNNIEKRKGILFDLGGFYDVSEIELDVALVVPDGRYVYDYTVYGGAVADGSLLTNLISHGGSTEEMLSSKVTYNKSIRYVLIVFNKLGTDPGNLNDDGTRSLADKVNKKGALKGCTWADAGIYLGEVSIYGKEGVDTTSTVTYTDPDSGVKVEVITYDNDVLIEKIAVSRVPVTDIQKGAVKLDAMYVLGDAYKIEFYDKDSNLVTDMKGRQFKVYFPMYYGDETGYAVNADGSVEQLVLALDMDNNQLVYSSTPERSIFSFIIASYTEPTESNSQDNDKADTDNVNIKVDVVLIVVSAVSALLVIGSIAFLLVFLKRRKNKFN